MEYTDEKRLQKVILIIAEEIVRICKKNNIPYSIDYGTLLGAMRHKGFIPWDDDFDISMPRDSYEKFIKACDKDLDKEKFFLQTSDSEPLYALTFGKLQLLGTEIVEDFSSKVDMHHGIFVDIVPVDILPEGKLTRKFFLLKNLVLKDMVYAKCGCATDSDKKKLTYKASKILSAPFSLKFLKKWRYNFITKYNDCGGYDGFNSDYPRYVCDIRTYKNLKEYPFEDTSFLGFPNADKYLTGIYGNYMELPPVEKRRKHSQYKVDFGKY